jgi:error-prone DNA polymerase
VREVGKALGLSEDVTGLLAKSASSPGAEDTLAEVAAVSGLDKSARRLRMSLDLAWKVHQVLAGMVQPV